MATGGIARTFTKDLLIDPKTRGTTDIVHIVTAVASSSSVESAKNFITDIVAPKQQAPTCLPHGSYQDLVEDPNVDIIYIATPHSHHYQNCMLALQHGKAVLCEKAFTVNAAQAKKLYSLAREKNLFLMEAVWTRYFPLSIYVREQIQSGALGEVMRVTADLSIGTAAESFEKTNRMVNLDLAGGCLLDLGIYSLTWIFQTLYHTVPASERKAPSVTSAMTLYPETKCDMNTTMVLTFPRSTPKGITQSHGIATTAMNIAHDPDGHNTAGPAIRIYGTKAELQIFGPAFRPSRTRLITRHSTSSTPTPTSTTTTLDFPFPGSGHGMFWEADEAARCLLDGKLESEGLTWEESTVIMEVMDQVREQGGLRYPEEIESLEWPLELK